MPNSRFSAPGSGGPKGATAPGANRHNGRSAALSARARQLTPQARERGVFELSRKMYGPRVGARAGVLALAIAITALCAAAGAAFAQVGSEPTSTTTSKDATTSDGSTAT